MTETADTQKPPHAFERFLSDQDAALRRMSRLFGGSSSSSYNYTADDLCAEAWIVACTVGAEQQKPLELGEPGDQQLLLERLRRHVNALRRGRLRTASIDQGGDDSGKRSLLDVLAATEHSDPLVRLQASEEAVDWLTLIRSTFAEYAAYVILFIRFEWDRSDVAKCLRITIATLRCRLVAACERARFQPSLFDGVDHVDPDFDPVIGKGPRACDTETEGEQLTFLPALEAQMNTPRYD